MAIEWVPQSGGGTVSVVIGNPIIAQTSPSSPYKKLVTVGAPSSGTLLSWDLNYKLRSASTWIPYATGITTASREVADLSAGSDYDFQTIGHVTVPYTTRPSVEVGTTIPEPPDTP